MEKKGSLNKVKFMEGKKSVDYKKNLLKNNFPYDEELFIDVRKFIEDHLDLTEDAEYDVLTAKVFESWIVFKFKQIGYVFFIGPPRSGKTRGLEVMSCLCFNPIFAGYMSGPAIYRTLDKEFFPTLFLDEIQQYLSEDKLTFMAILNAGQRRDNKAIIMVRGKEDWEPKGFDTYGSKFLASTKETAKALSTRCIVIPMVKNARKVPLKINKVRAESLRDRLDKWAGKAGPIKLPDVEPLFHKMEFHDYRNIETFINLVSIAPPIQGNTILRYAKDLDDQISEEEGINFYADLYHALEVAYQDVKGGKVGVGAITNIYNEGRPEQEQMRPKQIGAELSVLGLKRRCRMSGGGAGRYISENLMKRLRKRYKTGQQILIENG